MKFSDVEVIKWTPRASGTFCFCELAHIRARPACRQAGFSLRSE